MATAGASGGSQWLDDTVAPPTLTVYRWNLDYDSVARTVTLDATCRRFQQDGQGAWAVDLGPSVPPLARLWAVLTNGQDWPGVDGFDVAPLVNQGPQVTTNVRLRLGTTRGVGLVEIRDTARPPA